MTIFNGAFFIKDEFFRGHYNNIPELYKGK